MRISDWSSDVCSSDLRAAGDALAFARAFVVLVARLGGRGAGADQLGGGGVAVGLFGGEAVELARLGRDDEARLDDVVIGHAAPQPFEMIAALLGAETVQRASSSPWSSRRATSAARASRSSRVACGSSAPAIASASMMTGS